MIIKDKTTAKARKYGIIFLHDCEDCKHSNGKKCIITNEHNIRSTDCIEFEWRR